MPLETATYISDLNTSNPAASDQLAQADDHMRLLKATIKATLPNLTGAMTLTQAQLNQLASMLNAAFTQFTGNGAVLLGSIHFIPFAYPEVGSGGVGTGHQYLECDGSIWPIASFPLLGARLGATFGGNGTTTFAVPDFKTTGKFLRHRTASVGAGTFQSNQNKSHTHTYSGDTGIESVNHQHAFGGTTGDDSPDHTHNLTAVASQANIVQPGAGGGGANSPSTIGTGGANNRHQHSFSGTTGNANASHTHSFSGTTSTGSADGTEARPEAYVGMYVIKT